MPKVTANELRGQRRYEWAVCVLLLLVAFWFRTTRLADVPPGLHHDDIKNVLLVDKILAGYWRVYYPENYGHEPLYHWLQAAYFWIVGDGYPELRLPSVGISILGLAAIYLLTRRLLGREGALWTLAWQAVSLWPLFYSRRAIRGILLPGLAALAGYFFLRGMGVRPPLSPPRTAHGGEEEEGAAFGWGVWVLGGVALAGCLYTYAGSRVLPLFFLLYVGYLALLHRPTLRAHGRGLLIFVGVTVLLAAPLAAYLIANPEERMGQIDAPLASLKAGDPRPLLENSLRVLGMFTFLGDPHARQFVADTPVFGLPGAILFYAGLLLALWRWRRPAYAFLLLWLPVALLPGMLSEGAPNFLRPIAAQAVAYAFPALAARELSAWLRRRLSDGAWNRAARALALALLIALLGLHAWRTFDGYFVRWPRHPDARFAYNTTLLEVSRTLDRGLSRSPAGGPAIEIEHALLSGHFPADLDPALVESFLRRSDLEPRWADVRQALVYPAGAVAGSSRGPTYLFEPDHFPVDPTLQEWFVQGAPLYERHTLEGASVFAVYRLEPPPLVERLAAAQGSPVGWSRATTFPDGLPEDWTAIEGPVSFAGRVDLLGYELLNEAPAPRDGITLLTYWRAAGPGPASGITFLHLLGPGGRVLAGEDRFGAPPNQWHAGDLVVQAHRLALPGDLAPGPYPIELGWYERESGTRWTIDLPQGAQVDRLLLRPVQVAAQDR